MKTGGGEEDEGTKQEETIDEGAPQEIVEEPTINLVEIFQAAFKRRAASSAGTPDAHSWYNSLPPDERSSIDLGLTAVTYRGCMMAAKKSFDKIVTETQASRERDMRNSGQNGRKRSQSRGGGNNSEGGGRRNRNRRGGRNASRGRSAEGDRGKWPDKFDHYRGSGNFSPGPSDHYNNPYAQYGPAMSYHEDEPRFNNDNFGRYRSRGRSPPRDWREENYYDDPRYRPSSRSVSSRRSRDDDYRRSSRRRSRRHTPSSSSSESSYSRHRRRRRSRSRSVSRGHRRRRSSSRSRSRSGDRDKYRHSHRYNRYPEEDRMVGCDPSPDKDAMEEGQEASVGGNEDKISRTTRRSKRKPERDDHYSNYHSKRHYRRSRSRSRERRKSKRDSEKPSGQMIQSPSEKDTDSPRKSKRHHRRKSDRKRRSDVSPSRADDESVPPSDRKKKNGREPSSNRKRRKSRHHDSTKEVATNASHNDDNPSVENGEVVDASLDV